MAYHDRMLSADLREQDIRRVQKFLSSAVDFVDSGIERYWIYICLGRLAPDLRAKKTLRHAMELERDEFARRGVMEALSMFN